MPGCLSLPAARASAARRRRDAGSGSRWACSRFTATARLSLRSRACQTSALPPRAMRFCRRYRFRTSCSSVMIARSAGNSAHAAGTLPAEQRAGSCLPCTIPRRNRPATLLPLGNPHVTHDFEEETARRGRVPPARLGNVHPVHGRTRHNGADRGLGKEVLLPWHDERGGSTVRGVGGLIFGAPLPDHPAPL